MIRRPSQPAAANGFTIVEILVVLGVVILLAGLLLPVVSGARRKAQRNAVRMELAAIATALDAYRTEFGDYPRLSSAPATDTDDKGAEILCRALMGPGPQAMDGADGMGFRVRATGHGKVYGPYLQADQFRLGEPDEPGKTTLDSSTDYPRLVLIDRYGGPILYYPANPRKPNIRKPDGLVTWPGASTPLAPSMIDGRDNDLLSYRTPDMGKLKVFQRVTSDTTDRVRRMAAMLGDRNFNGYIDSGETPAEIGAYILWSAGADGYFGPKWNDPADLNDAVNDCDDVTNLR